MARRPRKKVAIVGFGGLGHMGVKLAHALGAEVTVLSQTLSKEADGKRFGAAHYHATSDPATFAKLAGTFDLIINTVSPRSIGTSTSACSKSMARWSSSAYPIKRFRSARLGLSWAVVAWPVR